jgi:hypothetical protein
MDQLIGKEQDLECFIALLYAATPQIENSYFELAVAGQEEMIFRERVYCYELYHQLRTIMPSEFDYMLDGELDKSGHPYITGAVKPDFLVHKRGMMNRNLVVIEVKPITASREGITKDINTLSDFILRWNYFRAIYLFYGDKENLHLFYEIPNMLTPGLPEQSFFLFWHRYAGESIQGIGKFPIIR